MRIIAGSSGGHALKVPAIVARPTTDRVREAIFSMLGGSMEGLQVLDLFAGSGAMGLEALSRGAGGAHFVEQHSGACAVIQDNLSRTKLPGGKFTKADAFLALKRLAETGSRYNVIFADPPYAKRFGDIDHGQKLLVSEDLRSLLAPEGFFVLETMVTKHDSAAIADWTVVRDRTYGSTRILILQLPSPLDGETSSADPA